MLQPELNVLQSIELISALLLRLRGGLHERELLFHHAAGALDLAILLDELLLHSHAHTINSSSDATGTHCDGVVSRSAAVAMGGSLADLPLCLKHGKLLPGCRLLQFALTVDAVNLRLDVCHLVRKPAQR